MSTFALIPKEKWLARAQSALSHRTVYWLGVGGENPQAQSPGLPCHLVVDIREVWKTSSLGQIARQAISFDKFMRDKPYEDSTAIELGACDCTGFLAWVLGVPAGGKSRITTEVICDDAKGDHKIFVETQTPQVLDFWVFPRDKVTEKPGHIALITEVQDGKVTRFIDCSALGFLRRGDAIQEWFTTEFEEHATSRFVSVAHMFGTWT